MLSTDRGMAESCSLGLSAPPHVQLAPLTESPLGKRGTEQLDDICSSNPSEDATADEWCSLSIVWRNLVL